MSPRNTMLIPWAVVQGFDIGMCLQLDGPLMAHPAPKHATATKVEIQTPVAVLSLAASEVCIYCTCDHGTRF